MMETRFIEGGEYIDRKTYIETRDENSRLRERIAELEARLDAVEAAARLVVDDPVQINLQRLEQALEKKDG